MKTVRARLAALEQAKGDRLAAIIARLSDDDLAAICGDPEDWARFSDRELEAMAAGRMGSVDVPDLSDRGRVVLDRVRSELRR